MSSFYDSVQPLFPQSDSRTASLIPNLEFPKSSHEISCAPTGQCPTNDRNLGVWFGTRDLRKAAPLETGRSHAEASSARTRASKRPLSVAFI